MNLLLAFLPLACLANTEEAQKKVPKGTYRENTDDYVMQVTIISSTMCDVEFIVKAVRAVFFIAEAPYVIDETTNAVTLFPRGAAKHPVVSAMTLMLDFKNAKIEFPSHGHWFPDADRLTMRMNYDWGLTKMPERLSPFQLLGKNPGDQTLYFGPLRASDLPNSGSDANISTLLLNKSEALSAKSATSVAHVMASVVVIVWGFVLAQL
jgi:hypothetical protein